MSEKKLSTPVLAMIAILVAFGVLGTVSEQVGLLDTTGQPDQIVYIVEALKWICTSIVVTLPLALALNVTGYIKNILKAKRKQKPSVGYNIYWLSMTVVKMEGWVLTVTPFVNKLLLDLPPEQKAIAMTITGAVFALIKITFSELKGVLADVLKPG